MCPWKWHPFLVDTNYDYLGAQQPKLTLLTSEEAFLAPFPPPPPRPPLSPSLKSAMKNLSTMATKISDVS